jgi:hypothetical protein
MGILLRAKKKKRRLMAVDHHQEAQGPKIHKTSKLKELKKKIT